MTTSLEGVERYEELLQRHETDGPYDYEAIFSGKGFWADRANRNRFKLLRNLDDGLRAMLHPGERVAFLTTGRISAFWERVLFLVRYIENRRALVFTNERLLLIKIDSGGRRRQVSAQVPLGAIKPAKVLPIGPCVFSLHSGRRFRFRAVPLADRKGIRSHLEPAATAAIADPAVEFANLCPRCFAPVAEFPDVCPRCNAPLKSATRAGLLSLLFPGIGQYYLGNNMTAYLDGIIGVLFWYVALFDRPLQSDLTPTELTLRRIALVAGVHLWMGACAWHAGRQGHYPGAESFVGSRLPSPIRGDNA